ncbi:unnamed protein product [Amoebophrya sp. A25]|nr:unnamed protein product [Amoebophrya sp. A25]|eukprot:GSA25T00003208001.1
MQEPPPSAPYRASGGVAPTFAGMSVWEQEAKYQSDLQRIRRNGHIALGCSVLCFVTGCCNYCANCCIVPWLAIFGQKASSVPADLDQKHCCCACAEYRASESVRMWSNLTFLGLGAWAIALIGAFAYAQGILVYPDYHCNFHNRSLCSTCFEYNSTTTERSNGAYVYPHNSWGACIAGPGPSPLDRVTERYSACYYGRNLTLENSASDYSYHCPYYREHGDLADEVQVAKKNPFYYSSASNQWLRRITFGLTCFGYDNAFKNPKHPMCIDICRCLNGESGQTDESASAESYAVFAIVLSICSTLTVVLFCAIQLDTRQSITHLERLWPLVKANGNSALAGGHTGYGQPVVGVPHQVLLGHAYSTPVGQQQPAGVFEGTPAAAGPGGQSGVATGIPVAASGPTSSRPSRGPTRKTFETHELESYESLLSALDTLPDGNLRRVRGLQYLASNMVTCVEFAEISRRIDFHAREEFIITAGIKNCVSDLPNLRMTLSSILDEPLGSARIERLCQQIGLDSVGDASMDSATFGTADYGGSGRGVGATVQASSSALARNPSTSIELADPGEKQSSSPVTRSDDT